MIHPYPTGIDPDLAQMAARAGPAELLTAAVTGPPEDLDRLFEECQAGGSEVLHDARGLGVLFVALTRESLEASVAAHGRLHFANGNRFMYAPPPRIWRPAPAPGG
ncbi:MAG TPA: hypothetical protein VNO81_14025 [Candidatus Nitrosotenuis sp.]|jgi:hypothetical protein|nr:hypothetical protein [Candidatus Nitrosotenuis sp.]